MKTLNCLIFATFTFTAAAHADPIADLSNHLTEKLNDRFSQMSSELTSDIQVSLENRLAEMVQQVEAKQATPELVQPLPAESVVTEVTVAQHSAAGSVQ